jgi:hypothetical protein
MPEPTNPNPTPAPATPPATPPADPNTPPATPPATTESIIEKDGVQYIRKDSYDVVAEKARIASEDKKKREADEAKAKEDDLRKKGEFETLAKAKEEEALSYKQKFELSVKNNALFVEATKLGAIDLDAVSKLVDLSKVELSEDGSVKPETVTAVLESLKAEKAYLFGATPTPSTIGNPSGGAPGGGNPATRTFKRSELQNHAFYKANEAEILQAYKEGKIIDDIDGARQ